MEEKRAQIIRKARELFHQNGYRGAPLSALIADLGISKPTFYNYFRNKRHLFHEVMLATYNEFVYEFGRLSRRAAGALDRLDIFVRTYAWFLDTYPLFRDIHLPGNDLLPVWLGSPYAQDLATDGRETVRAILEQGIEEETFDATLDVDETADIVFRAVILLLSSSGQKSEGTSSAAILRILATGLLPRSPGE